ncbi:MAG: SGNH/GDSL hydrolase family protein [Bacteroidota bacterium]
MNQLLQSLSLLFLLSTASVSAQQQTILVDFGNTASPAPWNNLSNPNNGRIDALVHSLGLPTNIALEVIDSFTSINTSGTQSPDPALGLPGTASGDSFYGNPALFSGEIQPTGGIRLSNLALDREYTISLFASRLASDNRETQYVWTGQSRDTAYLNVAGNISDIVEFTTFPAADGTIEVIASKGPNNNNTFGFFYLGALKMTYAVDSLPPPSLSLRQPDGGEFWQLGKPVRMVWESTTGAATSIEYSTDGGANWELIETVPAFQNAYEWEVAGGASKQCLLRINSDSLQDQTAGVFEISASEDSCRIVVIGSSTAAGTGASIPDSAWVNRYREEIYQNDTRYEVFNLARGGYTTYHLLPSGDPSATGVGITIDTLRNITQALSLNPAGVIINLPSNDAANSFPVEDQMTNFNLMVDVAAQQGVKTWVCTTQPRNFGAPNKIQIQLDARDSILAVFGERAIDFWTGTADSTGRIQPQFDSGDGVHLNDLGHRHLYEQVLKENIIDQICDFTSVGFQEALIGEDLTLQVFPNPFQSSFHLQLHPEQSGTFELLLHDTLGRTLYHQQGEYYHGDAQVYHVQPQLGSEPSSQLLFLKVSVESQGRSQQKTLRLLHIP